MIIIIWSFQSSKSEFEFLWKLKYCKIDEMNCCINKFLVMTTSSSSFRFHIKLSTRHDNFVSHKQLLSCVRLVGLLTMLYNVICDGSCWFQCSPASSVISFNEVMWLQWSRVTSMKSCDFNEVMNLASIKSCGMNCEKCLLSWVASTSSL